jgi:hypothetical protein
LASSKEEEYGHHKWIYCLNSFKNATDKNYIGKGLKQKKAAPNGTAF